MFLDYPVRVEPLPDIDERVPPLHNHDVIDFCLMLPFIACLHGSSGDFIAPAPWSVVIFIQTIPAGGCQKKVVLTR